jgi:membrane-associated protein
MMEWIHYAIDVCLHLQNYLKDWGGALGGWLYLVLFAVLFCETGLVVTPFLPGDSLLFTVGALIGTGTLPLSLPGSILLMCAAAIIGDAVNYSIGYRLGPKVFKRDDSWLLNRKHLLEAQRFYDRHGGKAIILARFVPIIRTFAPFVAGIGKMSYPRFALYNITGGVAWVLLLTLLGWAFGGRDIVKNNFEVVILAIVVISVLPVVWEILRSKLKSGTREQVPATAGPGSGQPDSQP